MQRRRILLLSIWLTLIAGAVEAGPTSQTVWSGLVIANNVAEPEPVPAELTKIAAAKPDAIYVFLPGGMGVNFVKQFRQAELAATITFLSAFTVDESTLPALGRLDQGVSKFTSITQQEDCQNGNQDHPYGIGQ